MQFITKVISIAFGVFVLYELIIMCGSEGRK